MKELNLLVICLLASIVRCTELKNTGKIKKEGDLSFLVDTCIKGVVH